MIDTAVAFPEAHESDNPARRAQLALAIRRWCQARVPKHISMVGGFPPDPDIEDGWDLETFWGCLDDERIVDGGSYCTAFVVSYRELCRADAARIVAIRMAEALRDLEEHYDQETKRPLETQAKGKA